MHTVRHSYLGKIHSTLGYCLTAVFPDVSPGPTLQWALSEDCSCRPALLILCAHLIQSIHKAWGLYLQHLSQTSLFSSSITMPFVQAALALSCMVAFILELSPPASNYCFPTVCSSESSQSDSFETKFRSCSFLCNYPVASHPFRVCHPGSSKAQLAACPLSLPAAPGPHALLHPGFLLSHQHSGAPLRPCSNAVGLDMIPLILPWLLPSLSSGLFLK